ncbi:5'-nucleotidase C-terminal domain-containing protein [Microbispora sp. NPDC049125]|uniref:5'-nucleotidase C-terminal domain-containing protein n=1 Tax=Microbispora sp. NPDC049125 TaxID=3154929 RepID=UPI00346763A7
MDLLSRTGRRIVGLAAFVALASGTFVPAAHAAPESAISATASASPEASSGQDDPVQNPVQKLTIFFERTTASKCPVTFKVHGSFQGLPAGPQLVRYRVVGTEIWKTIKVPAGHGAVYTTVLETLNWDWDWDWDEDGDGETAETSVRIEVRQPDGLTSNALYYFKCGSPPEGATFGETTENVELTTAGGPLAELTADAYLDAVQAISGAEVALVSRYGFSSDLDAGPVTYEDLWATRPSGIAVDVYAMTGAQLKTLLAYQNPSGWVLTPSASLRYTVEGGVVTEITLNGVPVTDTQEIKIAANYTLAGGWEGFPRWEGSTSFYHGGPDDRGALATYIAKNSPVAAPAGDRVTIR